MELAIHERFSRRSLGPRSVPRFKRYLKVHITRINPSAITSLIFSEDGRARGPSSSFNNPYFYRGKSFRGKRATGILLVFLLPRKLQIKLQHFRSGSAKFPKTHGCESLTVICVLPARSLRDEEKKKKGEKLAPCSRRENSFLLLNAPYLRVASAAKAAS